MITSLRIVPIQQVKPVQFEDLRIDGPCEFWREVFFPFCETFNEGANGLLKEPLIKL